MPMYPRFIDSLPPPDPPTPPTAVKNHVDVYRTVAASVLLGAAYTGGEAPSRDLEHISELLNASCAGAEAHAYRATLLERLCKRILPVAFAGHWSYERWLYRAPAPSERDRQNIRRALILIADHKRRSTFGNDWQNALDDHFWRPT